MKNLKLLTLTFLFLFSLSSYSQSEKRSDYSLKVSPYLSYLEAHDVTGFAASLKLELLKTLGENYHWQHGLEYTYGRSSAHFGITYDEGGRPSSTVHHGLHSNWYYDVRPESSASVVAQLGIGTMLLKRTDRNSVYDLYGSGNVGTGLRLGKPAKALVFTLLFTNQLGLKADGWLLNMGIQLGFNYRFKS